MKLLVNTHWLGYNPFKCTFSLICPVYKEKAHNFLEHKCHHKSTLKTICWINYVMPMKMIWHLDTCLPA